MMVTFENLDAVKQAVGREVCVTDWLTITQERIDLFARATGDFQWIHVDARRAAAESPYGRTIAHGFLTLSLLGKFFEDYLTAALPFCNLGLNYGLNKVRFTQPVPVDSRIRARFSLAEAHEVTGGLQIALAVTVEIDGVDKPACIAVSVLRRYLERTSN